MTKLEQKLIEALKRRLQRLAALLPVLRQVVERYRALGGVTQETLDFVHTPIGLDLGGETPQELAVGILAQILLVKNGKDGRVRL